jgi:glycosyltransferase involved in cell wall biosynthesis
MSMASNTAHKVLIITNLFADPWSATRATFNQEQFGRLSRLMDVRIMVPVSWTTFVRSPLQYWRLKKQAQQRWPNVDYVIFWYVPSVLRGTHAFTLFLSLALQRFPTLFLKRWDCLLGSWGFPDAVATAAIGLLSRTPVVAKVHGSDVNVFTQHKVHRLQIVWALNRARSVVAVSKALAARLAEIGVNPERTTVLYNGVDQQKFQPMDAQAARAKLGVAPGEEAVLYIGNILVTKGCNELMEAFAALTTKRPAATLIYIGDGPLKKPLMARAAELGLADRVRFPGRVPHAELAPWFAAASVFCLPSYAEGVPNVVLEAMACGTPVVATDVGGIGEILPPFAGVLVPARNAEALARGLEQALGTQWDRAKTLAHAQAFDWTDNVRRLQALLDKAAG